MLNNLLITGNANPWPMIIMIVIMIGLFWFKSRSQKKKQREEENMRDSLEVGDEITTIGGIIGEIVSIKGETVTIETGKSRTKIRFLKSAIRNVDVSAAEKRGEKPAPADKDATSKVEKAPKVKEEQVEEVEAVDVVEEKAEEAEIINQEALFEEPAEAEEKTEE